MTSLCTSLSSLLLLPLMFTSLLFTWLTSFSPLLLLLSVHVCVVARVIYVAVASMSSAFTSLLFMFTLPTTSLCTSPSFLLLFSSVFTLLLFLHHHHLHYYYYYYLRFSRYCCCWRLRYLALLRHYYLYTINIDVTVIYIYVIDCVIVYATPSY